MTAQPRQRSGRSLRAIRGPLFLGLLGLGLFGCGGTTSEVTTDPAIEQYHIVRMAVLPFTVENPTPGQERGYATPAPSPQAAEKMTELLYRKLNAREGLAVVSPDRVRAVMGTIRPDSLTPSAIKEIGKKLDVSAVLTGEVNVYKERRGSAVGLERPQDAAEVGFAVNLISVKDGATLWTGQYYERQRPATEDLTGFLERGPRYLTVEQLADSAADHVLRKFPLGRPIQRESAATVAP